MTKTVRPLPTSVRFSEEELKLVQEYAESQSNSVSAIIRHLVIKSIKKEQAKENN